MNEHLYAIQHAFKGKLVGNKKMKQSVVEVLAKMPENIIWTVTENVWFVTSFEDAWAFAFTGNDFKNKQVVFLSDELFHENAAQIHWTVAHEIGHVILGHKNNFSKQLTKEAIKKQEKDADTFARQFFEQV